MTKRGKLIAIFMCLVFVGISGFSQIRQTGTIHGKVKDDAGNVLPGASVSISGTKLIGGEKYFITDDNGYYRFPSLLPGTYAVSVEMQGFGKLVRKDVKLHANITLAIDFNMEQSVLNEEVVVKASTPTIDVKSSATGITIMTNEMLMSVPSEKSLEGILKLAPGTEDLTAYGANENSNAYIIDGVETRNLNTGGAQTSADFNIIEEASIQGLGLSAEYGEYTGAVLMATTKSGSNRLSGLFEFRYNGENWNSDNTKDIAPEEWRFPSMAEDKYSTDSYFDIGLQLGGKIIHDKLWFFVSTAFEQTKRYPLGTPVDQKKSAPKIFSKLTYQMNPSNKLNFSINHVDWKYLNAGASSSVPPGIDVNNLQPEWTFNGNWTSILSPTTFIEAKIGFNWKKYESMPSNGIDVSCHIDLWDYTYSGNWPYYANNKNSTWLGMAHLSHYIPRFISGSHDIKVGLEFRRFRNVSASGYSGGALYDDFMGQPYMKEVQEPVFLDNTSDTFIAFIQDTWTITDRLTLNLGARYDLYWFEIPSEALGTVYNYGTLAPRIGFTYDILGDKKNVIKFHYGHLYEALLRDFFEYTDDRMPPYDIYIWMGSWMKIFSQEYPVYEIDPDLKQPYIREISAGYERELFQNASISLNFYYRTFAHVIGMVSRGEEWQEMTIINPGPDGRTGTADDLGTLTVYDRTKITNDWFLSNIKKGATEAVKEDPYKNMWGFELIFNKKFSERWQMIASYHYTKTKGNTNTLLWNVNNPNKFVNAEGDVATDYGVPHQFKILANVLLPLNISLGIVGQYISGQPLLPSFRVMLPHGFYSIHGEPIKTSKTEVRTDLDLRLEKRFSIFGGTLSLMGDIFNVLNSNEKHYRSQLNTIYSSSYGKRVSVKMPRTYRIGVRFIF